MPHQHGEISRILLGTFNGEGFHCNIWQYHPTLRVEFIADGDIDADGAFRAYHPDNVSGLDDLRNAGRPGNWYGIATDRNGVPFVQDFDDPAPGFYVSPTSYQWTEYPKNDPRRYVDSATVPFIVVDSYIRRRAKGVVLGCKARITNKENDKSVDCVVADIGPLRKIGELSIAAAKAIGIPSNARRGGTDEPILKYELWPDRAAVIGGIAYQLMPMTMIA